MRLNKNLIIVFLLLSVFAVGTLTFTDTVEAAKWKKIDSGNYLNEDKNPGYTKKLTVVSYSKDSKNIKMKYYGYKSKNNKKVFLGTLYLSKKGSNVKIYFTDSKGRKSKPGYEPFKGSVNQYRKNLLSQVIKW